MRGVGHVQLHAFGVERLCQCIDQRFRIVVVEREVAAAQETRTVQFRLHPGGIGAKPERALRIARHRLANERRNGQRPLRPAKMLGERDEIARLGGGQDGATRDPRRERWHRGELFPPGQQHVQHPRHRHASICSRMPSHSSSSASFSSRKAAWR